MEKVQINNNLNRPLAGPSNTSNKTPIILEPIKTPDGNYSSTGIWQPKSKNDLMSDESINNKTQNGANTLDVLKNGLENTIPLSPPINLNSANNKANSISARMNQFTKILDSKLWQYKVIIFNHKVRKEIATRIIRTLCIEDDFVTWPLRGYITIDNIMEGLERSPKDDAYFVRADARDEIYIEIKPILEQGHAPDEVWKIEFDGVIYDVEDLPSDDMKNKIKKFYFWDKRFHILNERNIQWSTATGKRFTSYTKNPLCENPIHATDDERAMYTGEAIASLLSEAGFEDFIDFTRWDWGNSKILCTAKADQTIWDCIQYILDRHISKDDKKDICIFNWNRGERKWALEPVWKIFKAAGASCSAPGERQIEHMFLEEQLGNQSVHVGPLKAPILEEESSTVDIKIKEYSKIRNYTLTQISGLDSSKAFISKPVYSHWHKKKQFDVDVKENEISNIRDNHIKKKYIENNVLSKDNTSLLNLNKTKKDQYSICPIYSQNSTISPQNDRYLRSAEGKGVILFSSLFLNQCLSFDIVGSSHRIAGTFIGIDRVTTSSDTVYDYQLCGQYLVTNVKHIISDNKYVNKIIMNKIHSYKELPVNEGVV